MKLKEAFLTYIVQRRHTRSCRAMWKAPDVGQEAEAKAREKLRMQPFFGISTGKTKEGVGNNLGLAILNNSSFKLQEQSLAAWYLTLG